MNSAMYNNMSKILFSCTLVACMTLREHAGCTLRSDGACFYSIACSGRAAAATFRPAYDCGDLAPYVTLHITHSSAYNVTAHHFAAEFDALVKILCANGNTWRHIQNNAFSNFKKVLYMDLSGNHINMLGSAFIGLEHMDSLNLSRNHIETVEAGTLHISDNTSRLHMLDLSYNLLEHLSEESFANIYNLRRLYLQGNKLQTLADRVFAPLIHLNYLNLCCSNMRSLPLTFEYLTSLTELDLSYNRLKKVDTSKVKSLEAINLSHNDIEEMYFEDIKVLPVVKLEVSFNKLKKLTRVTSKDIAAVTDTSGPLVKLHRIVYRAVRLARLKEPSDHRRWVHWG